MSESIILNKPTGVQALYVRILTRQHPLNSFLGRCNTSDEHVQVLHHLVVCEVVFNPSSILPDHKAW
jgi:hypothetical protein